MKLITTLVLTLSAVVALVAANPTPEHSKRTLHFDKCESCLKRYSTCFDNGHTQGQTGCAQTCREHVCHQTPECRKCGGELAKCPEPKNDRYHNACGNDAACN